MTGEPLLEINNLSVAFQPPGGAAITSQSYAVRDVSFSLQPGRTLALVGESDHKLGKYINKITFHRHKKASENHWLDIKYIQ